MNIKKTRPQVPYDKQTWQPWPAATTSQWNSPCHVTLQPAAGAEATQEVACQEGGAWSLLPHGIPSASEGPPTVAVLGTVPAQCTTFFCFNPREEGHKAIISHPFGRCRKNTLDWFMC